MPDQLIALATQAGASAQPPDRDVLRRVISPQRPPGFDVYSYSLWLHERDDEAWVLRQGGIIGEWRWFGPVDADHPMVRTILNQMCRPIEQYDRVDESYSVSGG